MGALSSRESAVTLTRCSMPPYSIKAIGSRHILVAGGGGSAKTGVPNEIQIFLLTYNQCSTLLNGASRSADEAPALRAKLTSTQATGDAAVMNTDLVSLAEATAEGGADGRFLVAAGEDDVRYLALGVAICAVCTFQHCVLSITDSYKLHGDTDDELERPSRLALELRPLARFKTDSRQKEPYQPKRLITGGTDGNARVWDVEAMLDTRAQIRGSSPLFEYQLEGEMEDADFSYCGTMIGAVSSKQAELIELQHNRRIKVPTPENLSATHKIRFLRFTKLSTRVIVFAAVYQQRSLSSKQTSYLTLWTFNREKQSFNLANTYILKNERISCMALSADAREFIACGTIEGGVYCFETSNLECVFKAPAKERLFITAVEFLPTRQPLVSAAEGVKRALSGPAADSMASIVALSQDQTIRLYRVPFTAQTSCTALLLSFAAQLLLVYLLAYLFFNY